MMAAPEFDLDRLSKNFSVMSGAALPDLIETVPSRE
jgi:hypothetical protein